MDGRNFNLSQGANGEWIVAGRMSVIDCRQCTKNPAASLSSFPLATLQGTAAPAGKPAAVASGQIELHTGEWACYGARGLIAGRSFHLKSDGGYLDGDKKKAGRYTHIKPAGAVTFQGGFLDGQTGRGIKGLSFNLSNTVSCEPWR